MKHTICDGKDAVVLINSAMTRSSSETVPGLGTQTTGQSPQVGKEKKIVRLCLSEGVGKSLHNSCLPVCIPRDGGG